MAHVVSDLLTPREFHPSIKRQDFDGADAGGVACCFYQA